MSNSSSSWIEQWSNSFSSTREKHLLNGSVDATIAEYSNFMNSAHEHLNQSRRDLMAVVAMNHLSRKAQGLREVESLCGSPIEVTMLHALIAATLSPWDTVALKYKTHYAQGWCLTEPHQSSSVIEAQKPIGNRKADLAIEYTDHLHSELLRWKWSVNTENLTVRCVVECDGHDFHEKTKEQASSDKRRDRELQLAGYHVLRFSGADIYKDACACAAEVMKFLSAKTWEKFEQIKAAMVASREAPPTQAAEEDEDPKP